ncbi:Hypothetical predicted protein [Mytilus galloprovincialis]|uniref:Major facilitator superfamily (MFS) profile domain-containing protein n=1 Tax=Mytilus galloprovincialis TaxID=29158 RepID=A0A8B6BQB7_MYTGA|nr:Hypothetical predicted protein [Mytilus galloprovincialis]
MTDLNEYLEETINKIGGFGPFQWILVLLIFGSKITDNWSTLMMTFGGAVPNWRCNLTTLYGLEYKAYNISEVCVLTASNISVKCNNRLFDPEMSTVVSEWDLVCERSWIPSTITSLQMGGVIAGGFVSGQMADTIGRKLTYVSALSALLVFNTAAAFSTSWQMFAALRFFIGMGCGFVSSVNFTFVLEFTTRESRSMLRFLPCREVFGILYACLCWWIHDWRSIQIGTATHYSQWRATKTRYPSTLPVNETSLISKTNIFMTLQVEKEK